MKQKPNTHFRLAEIQLVYKQKYKVSERPKITTSEEAYRALLSIWNMETISFIEEFKILLLNRANKVIGCCSVSSGGLCGTVADPRVIFVAALKASAVGLILAHNHPSGNTKPSDSDIRLTKNLKEAGLLLEIAVLDHIIITSESYLSFNDEGIV